MLRGGMKRRYKFSYVFTVTWSLASCRCVCLPKRWEHCWSGPWPFQLNRIAAITIYYGRVDASRLISITVTWNSVGSHVEPLLRKGMEKVPFKDILLWIASKTIVPRSHIP